MNHYEKETDILLSFFFEWIDILLYQYVGSDTKVNYHGEGGKKKSISKLITKICIDLLNKKVDQ